MSEKSAQPLSENPFGPEVEKYWNRRYDLFFRFDEGIKIDREALFSVKPEVCALEIVNHLQGHVIVDGTCGAGGISIAAARLGKQVIAVDIDPAKLDMMAHNAEIYGVRDKITLLNKDARTLSPDTERGTLYLDPPWGGPDYYNKPVFTFADFAVPVEPLISAYLQSGQAVGLSVPVNFDLNLLKNFGADFDLFSSRIWGRIICYTAIFRA